MKTIHVAAGIVRRGDEGEEILAVQRGYGDMAGLWEFPGGKVERGEAPADACRRELAEELGLRVTGLQDFYTVEYDYPTFHLSMDCFLCRIDGDAGSAAAGDADAAGDARPSSSTGAAGDAACLGPASDAATAGSAARMDDSGDLDSAGTAGNTGDAGSSGDSGAKGDPVSADGGARAATGSEPQARDRQRDIRWVRRGELATLEWMPADVDLVRALAAEAERPDEQAPSAHDGQEMAARNADAASAAAPEMTPGDAAKTQRAGKGAGKHGSKGAGKRGGKRGGKGAGKRGSDLLAGVDTSMLTAGEIELVRRRAAIKRSMKGNKRSDTKPEMLVRRALREAGLTGYRLQWKKAPGRPDIAFPGRKVAIFVNGCFWHRCPHCSPSMPKRNVEFWEAKFRRNVERDRRALAELENMGWTPIVIWECELKRDRIDGRMAEVVRIVRDAAAR